MTPMRTVAVLFAVLLATAAAGADTGSRHVRVDLLADASAVRPGQPFTVAVRFAIDPGWHIYWTHPGDSGLPTRVTLGLPPGFTASPVRFPVPTVITLPGPIVNYGYEAEAVLLATVQPPANLPAGQVLLVAADVDYLVCKDVCLPGKARPGMRLSVAAPGEAVAADVARFGGWADSLPAVGRPAAIRSAAVSAAGGGKESVAIEWAAIPADVAWLPELPDGWTADDVHVNTSGLRTVITYTLTQNGSTQPLTAARGLLAFTPTGGKRTGWNVTADAAAPSLLPRNRP